MVRSSRFPLNKPKLTEIQNDFPQLKYALLGGLGLLALIQRE
jgi:hypothetical protein